MEDLPAPGMPTSTMLRPMPGAGAPRTASHRETHDAVPPAGSLAGKTGSVSARSSAGAELRDTGVKGSTTLPAREEATDSMFRRPILLLATILVGVVLVALFVVGAFPPPVEPTPVERVLPNDRFQAR